MQPPHDVLGGGGLCRLRRGRCGSYTARVTRVAEACTGGRGKGVQRWVRATHPGNVGQHEEQAGGEGQEQQCWGRA